MTVDVVFETDENGIYDISLDENGDIKTADFFDTSIFYSIFGERRASANEVIEPQQRRGWIGNDADFENGSKIWLLSQARLTRDNLNRLEDEARKMLQWMIDDGHAVSIDDVTTTVSNGRVRLDIIIRRSRDRIDPVRSFILWENTGRAT